MRTGWGESIGKIRTDWRRGPFDRAARNSDIHFPRLAGITICLVFLASFPGGASESNRSADPYGTNADVVAHLAALGYVDFSAVPAEHLGETGVTLHRPELADPGYSLFNTRSENRAFLIDMEGGIAHEWYSPELEGSWHHVEMATNGDLFVIAKNGYIARLGWNSETLWRRDMNSHHDFQLLDERVFVLDRQMESEKRLWGRIRVIDDAVSELEATTGALLDRAVFSDLLPEQTGGRTLAAWSAVLRGDDVELFHMNSLEYVDRDLGGLPTKGTFLVCSRKLDLIALVDLESNRPVWSWGPGQLDGPHHPSVMRNGNILIFDNGKRRGWSRILELDPASREIVWEYRGRPGETFFSKLRGSAQELPNGNILVTESDQGRVFEITRSGEIAWEFFNPDVKRNKRGVTVRSAIYRMKRYPFSVVAPLLENRKLLTRADRPAT